jgi:multidrug efflux pump subunit AcrA (membrane-fusion protein)
MTGDQLQPIHKKRFLVLFALLLLLVAAGTIPLSQSIQAPCIVEPASVWYVARDGAGQIITACERNLLNSGGNEILLHFERPDLIEIRYAPHLHDGDYVERGDTIALIISREGLGRLSVSEADLAKAHAEHDALLAGARTEDIEIAQHELQRAEAAFESVRLEHLSIKAQYDSGIVSAVKWQETDGRYRVLEAEFEMAAAKIKALEAGARPEDIAIARTEIERLRQVTESARYSLGRTEAIISPINGRITWGSNTDILLRIECTDTMAAVMSISETTVPWLTETLPIEIRFAADQSVLYTTELLRINYSKNGIPGAYGVALLDNSQRRLQTGMTGKARIPVGRQTLFASIRAKLSG